MLKKIFKFMRKVIFSFFFLYSYNLIASPLNLIVPINIITVLAISILGVPAIFSFIIILLLIY